MLRATFFLLFSISLAKAAETPQSVVLTTVKEGHLTETVRSVGTFTPYNDVVLKAETAGRVETISFKEGESAKQDQELFRLHHKEQEAKVKKAEAALNLSKNILTRKKKLFEKNFISSQDLENAQSEVKSNQAELELAKAELAKTRIIAPFAGVLSVRKVSIGAYVNQGDELVRIQDLSPIRLIFQLPQKEIALVKKNDSVVATTDVYPHKVFEGKIEAIEPSVNEKTRSVTVYATFENKEKLLIPGLYAQIHPSSSTSENPAALLLPEQALMIRPDGAYVYRKVGDKASLTKVTIGVRTADQAEILSGLQKGEEVILEGQDKIKDGDLIVGAKN